MVISALTWLLLGLSLVLFIGSIISKKNRKKYSTRAILLFVSAIILPFALEDFLFFKGDAKSLLREDGIMLNGKYDITDHQIIGMTADMYETFTLKISNDDRNRLISELRFSPFRQDSIYAVSFFDSLTFKPSDKKYCDNERTTYIERQTYKKLEGYKADRDIITVYKNENKLVFRRINE